VSGNWDLVLPYRERLLRIALRRLPTREDAEDCVQEALIRVAYADALDPARVGHDLTAALARLCAETALAAAGQRALTRLRCEQRDAAPEDDICDQAEAGWIRQNVVSRLTVRQRDVLEARADGLSTREVARRLNITGKAAESALTRARNRIRLAAA